MVKQRRVLHFLLAVGAGLCLFGAFAPVDFWPAAFLGIALLVMSLSGRTWFGSFGLGVVAGCAFFIPLFEWAAVASGVLIAQIALGFAEALFIGVLAVIWQGLMRGKHTGANVALTAAAMGLTWVAMEQLRSELPWHGMPWGLLGFSQVDGPLVRLAPWGSTQLVGFGVVVVGVLVARFLSALARVQLGQGVIAGASAGLILVLSMFLPLSTSADSYLTVGFVQGIIPDESKLPAGQSRALTVTQNLVTATKAIDGDDVDLVLWPESASDRDPREDDEARSLITEASERLGVPLLLGTQRYINGYRYNDYVVWSLDQSISGVYSKQHPVPFGEYMPYRDFFRKFTPAVDLISTDMLAGSKPAYLDVELKDSTVRVATPICFEVADNAIVSEAVRAGAQLIVVPTNNASFGKTSESAQQFQMTRFRAIEHGRTAIQVSTVGVSGVVEPNGVTRAVTQPWTEDAQVARVGLRSELTVATRISEPVRIAVYAGGAALGLLAFIQLARRR